MSNVHVARTRRLCAALMLFGLSMAALSTYACASTLWGTEPTKACGPFGHYYDAGGCCMSGEELTLDGLCRYVGSGAARDAGHD